ncbi:hypothetical protein H8958_004144, partial [Nasalis larvatus]
MLLVSLSKHFFSVFRLRSGHRVHSLHPRSPLLVEPKGVNSSQVGAEACGRPTSKNTENSREEPTMKIPGWDGFPAPECRRCNQLSALTRSPIGTALHSQKRGPEKPWRTFAPCRLPPRFNMIGFGLLGPGNSVKERAGHHL